MMTQIKHFYFSFIIALDLYGYKTLKLEVRTKKYINVENLCELLLGIARDLDLGTSQKGKGCALWRYFTYHGPGGVATSDGIKSDDLVCDMKQATFRRCLKNLFNTDVSAHAANTKLKPYVLQRESYDAAKSA